MQALRRRVYAIQLNGIDSEILTREQVAAYCPILDCSPTARYPVFGASLQRRGGVARHDAVAWGYARGADARGVDIIQNCEVTGFDIEGGKVVGVQTTRGSIRAKKVGVVVAGHCGVLAGMAGFRLPIESHPLQAMVSEPIKPVLDCVVMSGQVHVYVSQSDKGELVFGAGIDSFNSYCADRQPAGGREHAERADRAVPDVQPPALPAPVGRHRRHLPRRQPDHRQDAGREPVLQLRLGHRRLQGDARLRPCLRAHHRDRRAAQARAPFALERFTTGYLIDEHGAAGVAH